MIGLWYLEQYMITCYSNWHVQFTRTDTFIVFIYRTSKDDSTLWPYMAKKVQRQPTSRSTGTLGVI